MALIKCPECGKEISDKSAVCIHCGYPIASEKKILKKPSIDFAFLTELKSKFASLNKKSMLIALTAVAAVVVLSVVAVNKIDEIKKEKAYQAQLEAEHKAYQNMLEESRKNIAPYLELIPCRGNENGKIELPSDLYDNRNNIEFLGMTGSVKYSKDDYGVYDTAYWVSHEGYTDDEQQTFVPMLDDYFGSKAVMDFNILGQWTERDYYWEDDSVPTVVVMYTSVRENHEEEKGKIYIYWDLEAEMPD